MEATDRNIQSALEEAATLGSSPESQPVAREPKAKKSRTLPPQSLKDSSSLVDQPGTDEITGERSQLPCFLGGSDAIKRITPATVVDLIDGKFSSICDEYYIIDSRYPFEYSGGHIETAININDFQELERKFFEKPITDKKVVIIFHCEFSSQRAPMMSVLVLFNTFRS
ncbi:Rhodanese-like domain-containing protein [Paraphysoderma sedebokerense]|nr:Rhodanese-like domain-containing protein [Paraphysoderma sedebokerense]